MRIILSVIIFSYFGTSSFCQENNHYFYDDGGISEMRNVLKINLTSPLSGDISLSYERAFNEYISVEFGLGKIVSFYKFELPHSLELPDDLTGYSLSLNPRFYASNVTLEGSYFGLQYLNRNYYSEVFNMNNHELAFVLGIQLNFFLSYIIDLNIGFGERKVSLDSINNKKVYSTSIIPFSLKVGKLF